jgi:DNA (cytosine-5)-methyltransferase 1
MKSLSLFTGIGGFDLGFETAGIETLSMCEADGRAQSVLRRHWPHVPVFDDVRNINGSDFRAIDIIHGGFPCQDISMAGKREGLEGDRSGLWWEFHRIISEAKPRFVVIENVAGLLSSGGRRDLGAIIGSLGKLGYMGGYRVLDARYFGVAQRRRRVFIVASLGTDCGQKILFEPESLPGDIEKSGQAFEEVAGTIRSSFKNSGYKTTELDGHGTHVVVGSKEIFATPLGRDPINIPFGENQQLGVRRLTPVECERLMGFPDNWTLLDEKDKTIPDTQRYKMCGNAVVVNVSEWLGKRIASVH